MQLTLLLPGLLLPEPVLADSVFDLTAPTLSLMLGRCRRRALACDWLATAFGTHEPLPVAALRNASGGGIATTTTDSDTLSSPAPVSAEISKGEWICLDPVHWQITREGITLDDPRQLMLEHKEANHLLRSLAPLFTDWGAISASDPVCWDLRLSRSLSLTTLPLPAACAQPIDPTAPSGPDGAAWRKLLVEAQTLLHLHPVNRKRGERGLPQVNSLWVWGQGSLPVNMQTAFDVVWSSDVLIAGLAMQATTPCFAPPDRFQLASGQVLAVLENLISPARNLDALLWRKALIDLENSWLAPALNAVKRGHCKTLRIIGTSAGANPRAIELEIARSDLLRIWRRPRPLTALT